jgi:transcriptional regulator with XRE-family HTH domain
MENFAQKLRIMRKQRGWTLEELGSRIGVSKVSAQGYESGRQVPDLSHFIKIADVLNVSLDELAGRKPY